MNTVWQLYSISFVGGNFIKFKDGFTIKAADSSGDFLVLSKSSIKLPFSFNGNPSVETFYFKASEGQYTVLIENIETVELRKRRLPTEQIFGKVLTTDHIGLLIKEAISDRQKRALFYLFIIGLLIINFAFVLSAYNEHLHTNY